MLKKVTKLIKFVLKFLLLSILLSLVIIGVWAFYVNHLKNQYSNGFTVSEVAASYENAKFRDFQAVIDSISEKYNAAGIQASIIFQNGEQWNGASGNAYHNENIPVTSQSLFNIGSVTKLYTSALVMSLIEEKNLSIEDGISNWSKVDNPDWKEIKIQQLLNHTSGIPDYMESLLFKILTYPNQRWDREELIETAVGLHMLDKGDFNYSNTNYLLLANLIEQLNQSSYRDALLTKIVEPWELKNTYYEDPNLANLPVAHSYEAPLPFFDRVNMTGFRKAFLTSGDAAGAILSTADDLASFTHALFQQKIVSEASLKQMTDFKPIKEHRMPLNTGYGLGVSHWEIDDVELWGHSGFIPGFSSITMYSPQHQYVISVLTNQSNVSARRVLGKLQQELLHAELTLAPSEGENK